VDREGRARLLSYDEGFKHLLGEEPPPEVLLYELPGADPEAVREGIDRLFRGETLTVRFRQNKRRLLFSLFPTGGIPLKVTGTVVDVTEGYRQEALLRAAEKLRGLAPDEAMGWLARLIEEELLGVMVEPGLPPSAVQARLLKAGRLVKSGQVWFFPAGAAGVLKISGRELTDEERRFLERLARVVALVEGHRRAVRAAKSRDEAYLQLLSMASNLEAERDPERLIELTLEYLLSLTGMDAGIFARLDGRRLKPVMVVGKGAGQLLGDYERLRPPVLKRAVQEAFRRRRVVEELAGPDEAVQGGPVRAVVVAPLWVSGRPYGALELFRTEAWGLSDEEREIVGLATKRLERALERAKYLRELERTREAILRSFGRILEYRDLETKGHTERVVKITEVLGRHLGFRGKRLEALRWGAYLHDLGKLAIPDSVLLKPGRLDDEEWQIMKSHPEVAVEMLRPLAFLPAITMNVVRYHHERWDGSGYPAGLRGEEIPLEARIFAVADVFDALISPRPYKEAWPLARALAEIERSAGKTLDPRVVSVFLKVLRSPSSPLASLLSGQ